ARSELRGVVRLPGTLPPGPPTRWRVMNLPGGRSIGERHMLRAASSTWRAFVVAAASLCLATAVAAQVSQTKETVPGGTAKVITSQVHGELVAKGSNWLIAKDTHGNYKLYNVQAGRKAIV